MFKYICQTDYSVDSKLEFFPPYPEVMHESTAFK